MKDKPDAVDVAEKQFLIQRANNTPENALDFNMQMLDPLWGKEGKINSELKKKLQQSKFFKDYKTGKETETKDELWALLGTYTRDLRLGNLDKEEILYCEHYLNLAEDLLKEGYINSFIIALSRVNEKISTEEIGNFIKTIYEGKNVTYLFDPDGGSRNLLTMIRMLETIGAIERTKEGIKINYFPLEGMPFKMSDFNLKYKDKLKFWFEKFNFDF